MEAIATKRRTKEQKAADAEQAKAVLRQRDKDWFTDGVSPKDARLMLEQTHRINMKGISVRGLAGKVCQFWLHPDYHVKRQFSKSRAFNSKQWDRMRGWVEMNRENWGRDWAGETVKFIARCALRRVRTNPSAMAETIKAAGLQFGVSPSQACPEAVAAAARPDPANLSPAQRQYMQFKQQHPGYLLLFRMGDFYELFFDDATAASRAIDIPLTKRLNPDGSEVAMAGVPFHAVESYLRKLIATGHKVAICEQVEDSKGKPAREVVRTAVPA